MLIIGEKIHILNIKVFQALEDKDIKAIISLAKRQVDAGADALDINLGPGRKAGSLLPEIISAIEENVDAQLCFPAVSPAFPAAAKACRKPPIINAVTADRDELHRAMSAAECFKANLVVLLTKRGVLPVTVDQWCLLAEEVIEAAEKQRFPLEKLYLDPVLRSSFDPSAPVSGMSVMDTGPVSQALKLIKELRAEGVKTIAGLSNISQHLPYGIRSSLHCAVLNLLAASGLDAVILNPLDRKLMEHVKQTDWACQHDRPVPDNISATETAASEISDKI